jgi:hypothetical protein
MPTYFRTDQARIQVAVVGVTLDSVSWDKMEGGDNEAPSTPKLLGGMANQIEMGGLPKRSVLTVERTWSDTLIAVYKALDNGSGQLRATASYTVLDASGNPVSGSTISYTGVLLKTERPNYDSESNAPAMLKLTLGLNGPIT